MYVRSMWVHSVIFSVGWLGTAAALGAEVVEHSGYPDCIELRNEHTRVVVCPACGGRVLEYSLNAANALYLDPKQNGWIWEPGKAPTNPYGGRLDIGPEKIVPKHPALWLGRWQSEIIGPRNVRLISQEDEATGVQLVREFRLDENSSRLTCTQIIRNVSDETKHWCHWSRTLARGGGIALIPLKGFSRFPNKYIMYEPKSLIDYAPRDPNIRFRDDFLEILGTPRQPKLGMDSYAGWLCYLTTNDLMFVKRFPTYPDRVYNEVAAITISIWYFKDIMCELEPIGPMENIKPGQSASFTETWWLLPHEFPQDRTQVNTGQIADMIRRHTGGAPG